MCTSPELSRETIVPPPGSLWLSAWAQAIQRPSEKLLNNARGRPATVSVTRTVVPPPPGLHSITKQLKCCLTSSSEWHASSCALHRRAYSSEPERRPPVLARYGNPKKNATARSNRAAIIHVASLFIIAPSCILPLMPVPLKPSAKVRQENRHVCRVAASSGVFGAWRWRDIPCAGPSPATNCNIPRPRAT